MQGNSKKVILVTGASRGLGEALVQNLARSNQFSIYGTSRSSVSDSKYCKFLKLNLSQRDTLVEGVNQIIANEGRIDYVIFNAGIAYYGPVDSLSSEELQHLYEVNIIGNFNLMQLVLPHMRKQCCGKILFVSSIRAVESHAYMGAYSSSKAALESIAFDWAVTLKKWNIEVSVVQPGPLDTGIELHHGSYFANAEENPYLPYPHFQVDCQSLKDASEVICTKLLSKQPLPFKFQTDESITSRVQKHVVDPSGNKWLMEQQRIID